MKPKHLLLLLCVLLVGCTEVVPMQELTLTSDAFVHNEYIPEKYTAYADNVSPPLRIMHAPERTETFALIMDDPDAERVVGHTFDHWVMWNIPVQESIAEGAAPGVQGVGSNGKNAYHGPRPPAGTGLHHYHFKLYALDTTLDLPETATKQEVEQAMQGHILAETVLTGLYEVK